MYSIESMHVYLKAPNSKALISVEMCILSAFLEGGGGITVIIGKRGRAVPLQAWTDPQGHRRLRLPEFIRRQWAHESGKGVNTPLTGRVYSFLSRGDQVNEKSQ